MCDEYVCVLLILDIIKLFQDRVPSHLAITKHI
jgi:hypothetical protein